MIVKALTRLAPVQVNERLPSEWQDRLLDRLKKLLRASGKLGRRMPQLEYDGPASARAHSALRALHNRGVLLLHGMTGMGKTAVANAVMTKCQTSATLTERCSLVTLGSRPKMQHILNLQTVIFDDLFDGLKPAQPDADGRRRELVALLKKGGPYTIIVDDVWPVGAKFGQREHPLWQMLPIDSFVTGDQARLLLVGETRQLLDKSELPEGRLVTQRVRGLSPILAKELFMHYAQSITPRRQATAEELQQAAGAIAQLVPRFPLALRLEGLAWASGADPDPIPQLGTFTKTHLAKRLGNSFDMLPSDAEREAFLAICTSRLTWPAGQPWNLLCGMFGDATISCLVERGFLDKRLDSAASHFIASPPPVLSALASNWCNEENRGEVGRCWRLVAHEVDVKLVRSPKRVCKAT